MHMQKYAATSLSVLFYICTLVNRVVASHLWCMPSEPYQGEHMTPHYGDSMLVRKRLQVLHAARRLTGWSSSMFWQEMICPLLCNPSQDACHS